MDEATMTLSIEAVKELILKQFPTVRFGFVFSATMLVASGEEIEIVYQPNKSSLVLTLQKEVRHTISIQHESANHLEECLASGAAIFNQRESLLRKILAHC